MIDIQYFKQLYDTTKVKRNLEGKNAYHSVVEDGMNLRYVVNQTPALCLAAVKQNGWSLQFVNEQTPDICLAAVKQKGWALQHVNQQTPAICLAAVQQDGYALRFVKEQTPAICIAALNDNREAIQYVEPKFFKKSNKCTCDLSDINLKMCKCPYMEGIIENGYYKKCYKVSRIINRKQQCDSC